MDLNRSSLHEYRDHSNEEAPPESVHKKGGGGSGSVAMPFPEKLHMMLTDADEKDFAHIVSWQPHGRSFVVHQPTPFVQEIMPQYFRQTKMTSFKRQLNLYDFNRFTRGRDKNGYYHELFLRGMPHLCRRMTRVRAKGCGGVKSCVSPDKEPDLYRFPFVNVNNSNDDNNNNSHYNNNDNDTPTKKPLLQTKESFFSTWEEEETSTTTSLVARVSATHEELFPSSSRIMAEESVECSPIPLSEIHKTIIVPELSQELDSSFVPSSEPYRLDYHHHHHKGNDDDHDELMNFNFNPVDDSDINLMHTIQTMMLCTPENCFGL